MGENQITELSIPEQIGEILSQARQSKFLSVADVAHSLKLTHTRIEAIEQGKFEKLPDPVFARGFIRNYAKLLGVENEISDLLNQVFPQQSVSTAASRQNITEKPKEIKKITIPRWVWLTALITIIIGSIYWWQNKSSKQTKQQDTEQSNVAATPVETPTIDNKNVVIIPLPENTITASEVASEPETTPEENLPKDKNASQKPMTEKVKLNKPQNQIKPSTNNTEINENTDNMNETAVHDNVLNINIKYRSYLTVNDSTNKFFVNQVVPGGSQFQFSGKPPYQVRIGYAYGSSVNMNGKNIDIRPYIQNKTATLTVPASP